MWNYIFVTKLVVEHSGTLTSTSICRFYIDFFIILHVKLSARESLNGNIIFIRTMRAHYFPLFALYTSRIINSDLQKLLISFSWSCFSMLIVISIFRLSTRGILPRFELWSGINLLTKEFTLHSQTTLWLLLQRRNIEKCGDQCLC